MKTHAPESRRKNTPKPSIKQGENPSQLGHLADEPTAENPIGGASVEKVDIMAVREAASELERAIWGNEALLNMVQNTIAIQHYESISDIFRLGAGIAELARYSNGRLSNAFKAVWKEIGNDPVS